MAHELVHRQRRLRQGSYYEELIAHIVEAKVWREVRKTDTVQHFLKTNLKNLPSEQRRLILAHNKTLRAVVNSGIDLDAIRTYKDAQAAASRLMKANLKPFKNPKLEPFGKYIDNSVEYITDRELFLNGPIIDRVLPNQSRAPIVNHILRRGGYPNMRSYGNNVFEVFRQFQNPSASMRGLLENPQTREILVAPYRRDFQSFLGELEGTPLYDRYRRRFGNQYFD